MGESLDLERALVVGVASSALFDLAESDAVFREKGEEEYRAYQREHLNDVLAPGVAFPFIRRLLDLNALSETERLVEVVILSRNDPETGMRVMRSVQSHGLDITRAIFMQGHAPYLYMGPLKMSLFLSANEADVREATELGFAAGHVVGRSIPDDGDSDLRIAFDFDGVLADDSAERKFQSEGLDEYQESERALAEVPLERGPMADFLEKINRIQGIEDARSVSDPQGFQRRVRVAVETAVWGCASAPRPRPPRGGRGAGRPPMSGLSTRSGAGGCASTTLFSWADSPRGPSWRCCSPTFSSTTNDATSRARRAQPRASTSLSVRSTGSRGVGEPSGRPARRSQMRAGPGRLGT